MIEGWVELKQVGVFANLAKVEASMLVSHVFLVVQTE
jgi:hypothetical protein